MGAMSWKRKVEGGPGDTEGRKMRLHLNTWRALEVLIKGSFSGQKRVRRECAWGAKRWIQCEQMAL